MDHIRAPIPDNPFNLAEWRHRLSNYFDGPELISAFTYGWDLSFSSEPFPKDARRNLPSVAPNIEDARIYIRNELAHGAIVGPIDPSTLLFPLYRSPIGLVPKKDSVTMRTIVDGTQRGAGINAWIPANLHRGTQWQLSLPTVQSIVDRIAEARRVYPGQTIVMWKVDYARYYRYFSIDPGQIPYLAIELDGCTYLDCAFGFGNRGAANCAQRTSWAVSHIFNTQIPPFPGTVNSGENCVCQQRCNCGDNSSDPYIDDTIGISPLHAATYQYGAFLDLALSLGLGLSRTPGHLCPPSTRCVALGILFDLEANRISLPEDKLRDLSALLAIWLTKTRATERELASITGKLLYAARVVRPGRIFLNRMLRTKSRAAEHSGWYGSNHVPFMLDASFKADVAWWAESLRTTNGISFLQPVHTLEVSLDASGSGWYRGAPGIGGFNHQTGEYFACSPPLSCAGWHISDYELVAHLIAAKLWGNKWGSQQILGHTDNTACQALISKGKSQIDQRLRMARTFARQQLLHNFYWDSTWVSTHDNVLADALSRFGDPEARDLFFGVCMCLGISPIERIVTSDMFVFEPDPNSR